MSSRLIGLMWVLPFIYPYHQYPLTTFYQEWMTVVIGLITVSVLLFTRTEIRVPFIVEIPIALTAVVAMQGVPLGLPTAYFAWMAVAMMLGATLGTAAAPTLAVALIVGAELNVLIGMLQHYQIHSVLDAYISRGPSEGVYANLGQRNHYADYLALGLASVVFIGPRMLTAALLATPLLVGMAMSGSRSSILYVIAIALYAYPARGWRTAIALVAGFTVVLGAPHLVTGTGEPTSTRLTDGTDMLGIRFYLWRESAIMFLQRPLLGIGFGQFSHAHDILAPYFHDNRITGVYNNAHNLVFQLAAEMGLAGLLALGVPLMLWVQRVQRHVWGFTLLAILGIHSLLEYPLWYTYFIGIAAFVLGMLDGRTVVINRWVVATLLIVAWTAALVTFVDYRNIEAAFIARASIVHSD